MNIHTANVEVLRNRFPEVLKALEAAADTSRVSLIPARNGAMTMRVESADGGEWRLLHSSYDPQAEAAAFVETFHLTAESVPLVIGFGLGYHVGEILRRYPDSKAVYIFETRADMLATAMSVDQSAILSHPAVRLCFESDQSRLLKSMYAVLSDPAYVNKAKLVVHRPSLNIYKDNPSGFTDIIEKIYINPKQQDMMRGNFSANLSEILRAPGIDNLFGKFERVPVFLVSAGPSLADNIDILARHQDKGVIIAATTGLRLLMEHGVRPDFLAIGDPKPIMETHFEGYFDCGIPLLFLSTAAANVIERYSGPKIVALQREYRLNDVVAGQIDKGRVDVGESVSTFMLDAAIRMGADPVVFIGQDLAFSDGHTHAQGIGKRLKITAKARRVKSVTGGEVDTSAVYSWILHWIEKRIADAQGRMFINTSGAGAAIKGTSSMSLSEVIGKYCAGPVDKKALFDGSLGKYFPKPD